MAPKAETQFISPSLLRIGTAGWSIPSRYAHEMPHDGSQLERYAKRLHAVEINSSFHRPHQRTTYEKWARSTPAGFLFSVKIPKAITHELRLNGCEALLDRFLAEATGLGEKLGVLLVQLPPSLELDRQVAGGFFRSLRRRIRCPAVVEPRHSSWFQPDAETWLADRGIARVAADPATVSGAEKVGGWKGVAYYRLHGSPRIYYSDYDATALSYLRGEFTKGRPHDVPTWCIFDNTASGAALGNALALTSLVK